MLKAVDRVTHGRLLPPLLRAFCSSTCYANFITFVSPIGFNILTLAGMSGFKSLMKVLSCTYFGMLSRDAANSSKDRR